MRYAKLNNNNNIIYAPNPILIDNDYIGNPPVEVYLEQGYKPVTYTQQPEPKGYGYYNETWEETPINIVQGWEWIEESEVGL